jgi:hypothetical protein
MNLYQKLGLAGLVLACVVGSFADGIRILTLLSTLALASYISAARRVDKPPSSPKPK